MPPSSSGEHVVSPRHEMSTVVDTPGTARRSSFAYYSVVSRVAVIVCARRRSSVQNRNRLPGPNCGDGTSSVCSLPVCQSKMGRAVIRSPHTMTSISSTTRSARSSRTSGYGPQAPLLPMPALRWVAPRLSRLVGRRWSLMALPPCGSPALWPQPGMSLARFRPSVLPSFQTRLNLSGPIWAEIVQGNAHGGRVGCINQYK